MEKQTMKRIIEINGSKFEIESAELLSISSLKVGDCVKLLKKEYSDYRSYPAIVVGFDPFKNLPTIIVAYLVIDYASATLKFAYINAESKDVEVCHIDEHDMAFDKSSVISQFDREIEKKKLEMQDIENKKKYFLTQFGKYFEVKDNG
jgi:hypothetical protein